jgi:hypothetical protein
MQMTFRPLRMETWTEELHDHWDRRSRNVFSATWSDTLWLLDRELKWLNARNVVIEADFKESDIRLDGMPRSNAPTPKFPGVRVAFESDHGGLVYQTDNCVWWQHNVRSVALGLEALRAVDRYGITHKAEQYTGFKAIGGAMAMGPGAHFRTADDAVQWLRTLEVSGIAGANGMSIKSLLKVAARNLHPDFGGSDAQWEKYDEAYRLIKKAELV